MYALYSKNKPQSDALLCSHGNEFFKVRLETPVTSPPRAAAKPTSLFSILGDHKQKHEGQ